MLTHQDLDSEDNLTTKIYKVGGTTKIYVHHQDILGKASPPKYIPPRYTRQGGTIKIYQVGHHHQDIPGRATPRDRNHKIYTTGLPSPTFFKSKYLPQIYAHFVYGFEFRTELSSLITVMMAGTGHTRQGCCTKCALPKHKRYCHTTRIHYSVFYLICKMDNLVFLINYI